MKNRSKLLCNFVATVSALSMLCSVSACDLGAITGGNVGGKDDNRPIETNHLLKYTLNEDLQSYSVGFFDENSEIYGIDEQQAGRILWPEEYVNPNNVLTIPSEYRGKPVTRIGDGAFQSCVLKTVEIPSTVKEIGDLAFWASSIGSIHIPASIESIGWRSMLFFFDSPNLTFYIEDLTSWFNIDWVTSNEEISAILSAVIDENGEATSMSLPKAYVNGELLEELVIPENTLACLNGFNLSPFQTVKRIVLPEGGVKSFDVSMLAAIINFREELEAAGVEYWLDGFEPFSNLELNVYGNGNYLGSESNPVMAFICPISTNVREVNIHRSTNIVAKGAFEGFNFGKITYYDTTLFEASVPETVTLEVLSNND